MWLEFVVGSLFPLLFKNQHLQIPIQSWTHGQVSTSSRELLSAPSENKLQLITIITCQCGNPRWERKVTWKRWPAHFALPVRPWKQDEKIASCYVSPHPNWSGSFTHYVITHTIWSTYNALPRYSMVANVHDYCIFKLFNTHAHSPQKEYRFIYSHVPSSTIPRFLLPASYIVLWKVATWRNK